MPSSKSSWKTVPDKQGNIHTQIDTVLQGHKKFLRRKAIKQIFIIVMILVLAGTLAFSKRANFSDSFLAEVLRDTELDQLFGISSQSETLPGETQTTKPDDLENLFAESESQNAPESSNDLEALFGQEESDIQAITEAREVSGLTPIAAEENQLPVAVTETQTTRPVADLTGSAAEVIAETVPKVAESAETTVPFVAITESEKVIVPNDAFQFPPDEEAETTTEAFQFPTEDVKAEVTTEEVAYQFPDETNVVSESAGSFAAFPINTHTVDQAPGLNAMAYPVTQSAADSELSAAKTTTPYPVVRTTVQPKSGPEIYLALVIALAISGLILRGMGKRELGERKSRNVLTF